MLVGPRLSSSASAARLASLSRWIGKSGSPSRRRTRLDDGLVAPPEVGRVLHAAGGLVGEAGHGQGQPDRAGAAGEQPVDGLGGRVGQPLLDRTGGHGGGVHRDPALLDHAAVEVHREDRDVVDVDLGAEGGEGAGVDLDDPSGPTDRAALHGALDHEAAGHELGHQAGDRGLVEPGLGGDPRPGAGPVATQVGGDDREVVAAYGDLVGSAGTGERRARPLHHALPPAPGCDVSHEYVGSTN